MYFSGGGGVRGPVAAVFVALSATVTLLYRPTAAAIVWASGSGEH